MKPTSEMSFQELVDYWTGYACVEIGRGEFRSAISLMLQDTLKIGFDRGRATLPIIKKN
jgi:hypothetical protein